MSDERSRKSRRLSGELPPALPPATIAGKKTVLRGLLATDSYCGRASVDSNPAKAWNFDAGGGGASSCSVSSVLMPSPFVAGMNKVDSRAGESCSGLFDDSGIGENADEDDDDDDDDASDAGGIKLIPFDELKRMFRKACVCKTCGSPVKLTQETYGLATNLYLTCIPRDKRWAQHHFRIDADKIGTTKTKKTKADDGDGRQFRDSAKQYLLNYLLVLGMQQLGLGLESMTNMLGTLGIRSSIGNPSTWRVIQDQLGIAEQAVKDEVLAENQANAITFALSDGATRDDSGRVGLVCSIDGAWQKRSAGRTYDSPSGHNMLVDARTKLILDCIVYSKLCCICDAKKKPNSSGNDDDNNGDDVDDVMPVDDDAEVGDDAVDDDLVDDQMNNNESTIREHRCPKNFTGSSKSMESVGAVALVEKAWQGGKFWVETVVGDDDSTSRSALTLDLDRYKQAHPDVPKDSYWPKRMNAKGKEVPITNKGKLHWETKAPTAFLCDPTHRQRVIGKHMFAMASQTGKTDVTRADALRIKRNVGYAHKQSIGKPYEEYKTAMKGALLHLGNDHSCCDASWCGFRSGKRDKKMDAANYLKIGTKRWNNIASVMDTYTTDDMLRMTYHPYNSQKNESLNTKTAAVAPKNKTFCKTMSLSDRIAFVVIVDSIGYDAGIAQILSKLAGGRPVVVPTELQLWMRRKDADARRKKNYQSLPRTKKMRAVKIQEKIKQSIADDLKAKKRGLDYGPGIAVAQEEAAAAPATAKGDTSKTTTPVCNQCGEAGHARITNKKCRFYVAPKKRNSSGHINTLSVEEDVSAGSNGNNNST